MINPIGKLVFGALFVAATLGSPGDTYAQSTDLTKTVAGSESGGREISNGTVVSRVTVGQTSIGTTGDASSANYAGFWGPVNGPTVLISISDLVANEDDPDALDYADLNQTFNDFEDAGDLAFSVIGNTNPTLVTPMIDPADSTLDLAFGSNQNGTATITVRAVDKEGFFADESFLLTINPVNDPPTLTATVPPLAYTENDGAVLLDNGVIPADIDNTNLASATISFSANYVSGEDVLAFVNQAGITGVFNGGSGILTLTGSASLANYQTAIRSITYQNTSENPSTLTRTVSFVVNDGLLPSIAATRDISVTAVNDAPTMLTTVAPLSYTENAGAVLLDNGAVVGDPDNLNFSGATLSITTNYVSGEDVLAFVNQNGITGSFNPGSGVLTLSGSSSLANYQTAIRSVTYTNTSENPSTLPRTAGILVNDGALNSSTATRTINITAVNDAPTLTTTVAPLAYTENDGPILLDPGVTVGDVDNVNLSAATISITANFVSGEDVLAFVNQAGITGLFNGGSGVLSLTGSSSLANYQTAIRSVTYTNTSENPSTLGRTVSFSVNDGALSSAVGTRTVNITAVNDAPVLNATAANLQYPENAGAVAIDNGLTALDVDNVNLVTATVSVTANYVPGEDVLGFTNQLGITGSFDAGAGVMTLTGSSLVANYQTALRSVTYANNSENPSLLSRTVRFVAGDGGLTSLPVTRIIDLTSVNDAPVVVMTAVPLIYTENDGPTEIDSSVVLSDPDNVNLASATVSISNNYSEPEDTLIFVDQLGISGSFDTGILTLTGAAPLVDYQAALRTISYENRSENPVALPRTIGVLVNDGALASLTVTRDITVRSVNDVPVLSGIPDVSFDEDGIAFLGLNAFALDPDNDTTSLNFAAEVLSGTNAPSQMRPGNWEGLGSDGIPGVDGLVVDSTDLQITIDPVSHVVSFSASPDSFGVFEVVFTVTDDSAASDRDTILVSVLPVNDRPVVVQAIADTILDEDDPETVIAQLDTIFGDIDGDLLSYRADVDSLSSPEIASGAGLDEELPVAGIRSGGGRQILGAAITARIDSAGNLYVTPEFNANGVALVTVTALDGLDSISTSFLVTVAAINDAPESFTLLSPRDSVIDSDSLDFTWNVPVDDGGSDSLRYRIVISSDPAFGEIDVEAQVDTNYFFLDASTVLENELDYYWYVEAIDIPGLITPSDTSVFSKDTKGPDFFVGLYRNTGVGRFLAFYLISSEALTAVPAVTAELESGPELETLPLTVTELDSVNHVYYAAFNIPFGGTLTFTVTGSDVFGKETSDQFVFAVGSISKTNTTASSVDGRLQFKIRKSRIESEGELLIAAYDLPLEIESGSVPGKSVTDISAVAAEALDDAQQRMIPVGPVYDLIHLGLSYRGQAELQIGFDRAWIPVDAEIRKIGLYRYDAPDWVYVGGEADARYLAVSGLISREGRYRLMYNPDHVLLPTEYSLNQNYPNPFNPTTRIRYELPAAGKVTLKIFNILGQEVRTLVNDVKNAGRYEVLWDGTNDFGVKVSSGVYLYRIQSEKFTKVRKMMLLK